MARCEWCQNEMTVVHSCNVDALHVLGRRVAAIAVSHAAGLQVATRVMPSPSARGSATPK